MAHLESYPQTSLQHRYIKLASRTFAPVFPNDSSGLRPAYGVLQEQHLRVVYQGEYSRLFDQVSKGSSAVLDTYNNASRAINTGNYGTAVRAANRLHAYSHISRENHSDYAEPYFLLSLDIHRKLVNYLSNGIKENHPDPVLLGALRYQLNRIATRREDKKAEDEYKLLRNTIHDVIKDGIFGEAARQQFDPQALIYVRSFSEEVRHLPA